MEAGRRPATLAQALRGHPGIRLRESGDPGARAFLGLTPIGSGGAELYVDGVPTRNPADGEASIYDQSLVPLGALRSFDARWDLAVPFALHAEIEPPLDGRTRLQSHFNSTAGETYYRGLAWSTPRAERTLRFDYEEWKTEEGYASYVAQVARPAGFGRAKQRRFAFTGVTRSPLGRLSLRFGRGRRFHDGELSGNTPVEGSLERWTGMVTAGIDRGDSTSHFRMRLFHLDWQDVDGAHLQQTRDAVRLGLRAERTVVRSGLSWSAQFERRAASFVSATGASGSPDPHYVGRLGLGHDGGTRLRRSVRVDGLLDDASAGRFDLGGALQLEFGEGDARYAAGAERRLRVPTLMELSGRWESSFGDGLVREMQGGGALDIERQDRLFASAAGRALGFEWSALAEFWRLRRGVRWRVVSDTIARHESGAALELPVAQLGVRRSFGSVSRGLMAEARSSHLLDGLQSDGHRGAGWPRHWMGASASAWTRFFHERNRLTLRYSIVLSGERLDDVTTPLSIDPSMTVLPWESRHDLRLTLRIRDAELYLLWENLADGVLQEISSSRLRGRQRVWGLFWNFYN